MNFKFNSKTLFCELKTIVKSSLKKILYYFSIVSLAVTGTTTAKAADGDAASGEVTTGQALSATDANGILFDANGNGALAYSIDPNGGITIGTTNDADAMTTASTGASIITVTVTDSSGNNDVLTIAGDITMEDNDNDDTLAIVSTNANVQHITPHNIVTTNRDRDRSATLTQQQWPPMQLM